MAIADRVKEAIDKLAKGDIANALIQISIAIDATAKKAYPKQTSSHRCKKFIRDNQAFITRVGYGKLEIRGDIKYQTASGEKSFEQILYNVVRCSLIHEGTIPDTIVITKENKFGVTYDGKVVIADKIIWALIYVVIGAHVNQSEKLPDYYTATIGETTLKLNELWGDKDKIYNVVVEHNK